MNEIILVTGYWADEFCLVKLEKSEYYKSGIRLEAIGVSGYEYDLDVYTYDEIELWCKVELPKKELK